MTAEARSEASLPWDDVVRSRIEKTRSRLLTREEFTTSLLQVLAHPMSPISAVQLEIRRPAPHGTLSIGASGMGAESATFPVDNFDKADCKIRTWSKPTGTGGGTVDFPSVTKLLSDWARAFWKANARDVTGLLWWQNAEIRDPLNSSIREWVTNYPLVSAIFADLDNFKAANDRFGQSKGDDVIQTFGALLESIIPTSGLVIRQGGDEFLVFFPAENATETLRLARAVSNAVTSHDFGTGEVKIGVAVGASTGTRYDSDLSAETLAHKAEKGVKPGGDASKLRGQVRFWKESVGVDPAQFTNESRDLAAARAKTSLIGARGLGQPWLDLISEEAEVTLQSDLSRASMVRDAMGALVDWAKPEWALSSTRLGTVQEGNLDRSSSFSRFDVALAVAKGVYRSMLSSPVDAVAEKRIVIKYSADLSACEVSLQPDEEVFFSNGETEQSGEILDLGAFFTVPQGIQEEVPGRLPILVHIGYEEPRALPKQIFDRVILVDARPSASGGLPDFWASTVANVISAVESNPNVPAVYVLGDLQHGTETINKLNALNTGDIEIALVADKTGLSLNVIRTASPRLRGRVVTVSSTDSLYEHVVECLRDPYRFEQRNLVDVETRPTLERPLHLNGLSLTREDGCRVGTINEAFPIVLEIARTSKDDPIRDQASRHVRELIDFKVHFTNPLRDQVPDFYRDSTESFEKYFQDQFLAGDGLFGRWFQHNDQLGVVLQHVAEVISAGHQFATRRAVLVIPHKTEHKKSPSPLGLISVRVVPRFRGDQIHLTFSYTWRTVEALVGFPYSSFGSVRFSSYLTERIKDLLPEELRTKVRMKDVSYVAHSLHFFVDDYGQKIARKIVNDATS